uniref:Uncharacterized protein n=1 Tax=Triticum urartu TaxID=4572 RepID=A0A8R7QBS8_TRIUA
FSSVSQRAPPSAVAGRRDRDGEQQDEVVPDVGVEGAEEVAELRQQRGEVTAGRHQGGERAEQEPHREQRRRRQH